MVAIFFQNNLEQNLEFSKFEYFFALTRIKPVFHHDMNIFIGEYDPPKTMHDIKIIGNVSIEF